MSVASRPVSVAVVQRIVQLATRAPSAENTQPWRLHWDGDRLTVFHDRRQEMASDVDSMLDLTGVGALIESLALAASRHGLQSEVAIVAGEADSEVDFRPIARLRWEEGGRPDPLAEALADRCTTRRMDGTKKLTSEQRDSIAAAAGGTAGVRVDWLAEKDVPAIARLIGLGNRIRFEREEFHRELFDNMRFGDREAAATNDGLDVATLQLPPGVAGVMHWLRKWPRARAANVLGFSRAVARQAAAEVRCSGAVGLLSVESAAPEAFVAGGRALLRVWLEATRQGLAFHPTASLPVFAAYAERTDGSRLNPRHQRSVEWMRDRLHATAPGVRGRTLQMAFRVGQGAPPAVRTRRRDTEQVLEIER